jgi:hypothetical protein
MKRRTNSASVESKADEIEKAQEGMSPCHPNRPIQKTIIYLIQADRSVEAIGQGWTCGGTHCFKPLTFNGYSVRKFKNFPGSFDQATWDTLKEGGWQYRAERGGGLYVERNSDGKLVAAERFVCGGVRPPKLPALSEKERAAANANMPDPIDVDLEKAEAKHAAQMADMEEGDDARFDEPFEG